MRKTALACIATGLIAAACAASTVAPPPQTPAPIAPAPLATAEKAPSLTLAQTGIVPEWMDASADPCQDYFAYACGGFVKNTVIPPDRAGWSAILEIVKANEEYLRDVLEKAANAPGDDEGMKKLGDYYAACTDEAAVEKAGALPIKPLLDDVAKVKDPKTLAASIAKLHALSIYPLFDSDEAQDLKDATHVIAVLDQDGLGLPDRDYYLKDEGNMKDVRTFYAAHVARMFALLGLKPAEAKTATVDVMRIETKLAKIQQNKVTRRDPYQTYHRVDRAGLPGIAKTFPWDSYFAALGIPGVSEISVNDPAYFTGIDALMHQEPPAAWRHYLTARIVAHEAPRLSKPFQEEAFSLAHKITGQKELPARWKRCVRGADTQLGELLAQPYVASKFAGDSKERAKVLTQAIHDAMRVELGLLPWMDDATRTAAIAKLDQINAKVGYPDHWRAYDFPVTRTDYAANALAADAFERQWRLSKIGKPVDRLEWDMTPPTVNAYYSPSLNEIVLPAGELQPPFFSRDFYAPVNIGDEGSSTIGHELTHGFDDEGSKFDGAGNLRDWWTKDTKAKFADATKCVQDQYSSYEAVPGVKLNGELTSGENIADIGGVKIALGALRAWQKAHPEEHRTVDGYTDEQIFFLADAQSWCTKKTPELLEAGAHADEHATEQWRVNGPMADVPAFAEAYHCKAGTPMNNGKVCSVW